IAATPLGVSTTRGARDWAVCVGSASKQGPPVAHLVASDGTSFHRFESTDGTSWTPRSSSPESLPAPVSELFLACGTGRLYAFTIGAAADGYPIRGASWNAGSDTWTAWSTVVSAPPARKQRCFLGGYDRVVMPGIGLLWTESDDCTKPDTLS